MPRDYFVLTWLKSITVFYLASKDKFCSSEYHFSSATRLIYRFFDIVNTISSLLTFHFMGNAFSSLSSVYVYVVSLNDMQVMQPHHLF